MRDNSLTLAKTYALDCGGGRLRARETGYDRILISGQKPVATEGPVIVAGKWHRVVATREAGKLRLSVDDKDILVVDDPQADRANAYLALYAWHSGTFRSIRVSGRPKAGPISGESEEQRLRRMYASGLEIGEERLVRSDYLSPKHPLAVFVSPDTGNDAWSGAQPEPDANGSNGPLATIMCLRKP